MSASLRVIPVAGVTALPDFECLAEERPQSRYDLVLLNVTTVIAVMVVSCAWILLTLD